jgi:hypothetical protein
MPRSTDVSLPFAAASLPPFSKVQPQTCEVTMYLEAEVAAQLPTIPAELGTILPWGGVSMPSKVSHLVCHDCRSQLLF